MFSLSKLFLLTYISICFSYTRTSKRIFFYFPSKPMSHMIKCRVVLFGEGKLPPSLCDTYIYSECNIFINTYFRFQKTESVIKTTAEKTSSIFGGITGGISSKLGQMRNSESFRSIEEKMGSAYENVKV